MAYYLYPPHRPYFCRGCQNSWCQGKTCAIFIYHLPFHRLHFGPVAPAGLMPVFHRGIRLVANGYVEPLDRDLPYNAPLLRFRVRTARQEPPQAVELQLADDGAIVRAVCDCTDETTNLVRPSGEEIHLCLHMIAAWSYRVLWAKLCENKRRTPQSGGKSQPPARPAPPPATTPKPAGASAPTSATPEDDARQAEHRPASCYHPGHTAEERVVGTSFSGRWRVVAQLSVGEQVLLRREPGNVHDKNAIVVERQDGSEIGFLSRVTAAAIAGHLDRCGTLVPATVAKPTGGGSAGRGVVVRFNIP